MDIVIYHNPDCGTSRNALAMIRNAGIEPRVIEYLKTPPSRAELRALVERMGVPLRAILRRKGTPYDELGLDDAAKSDEELYDTIERHPILINRPIVVTANTVKLCRPSEEVLELLDRPQHSAFVKEDGDPVVVAANADAADQQLLPSLLQLHGLPTADLAASDLRLFRFATTIGQTVGYGGLQGAGPDVLLRSLVVIAAFRGKGFGKAIALTLERLAGRSGARRLHLLTTTQAEFFKHLGWAAADRATAPASIAHAAEFTTLCPSSADYLVKAVRTTW